MDIQLQKEEHLMRLGAITKKEYLKRLGAI